MKVGFVTPSVSRQAGGLFDAVRRLAQKLNSAGESVSVYSISDSDSAADSAAWAPVPLRLFETMGPASLGFSPPLRNAIINTDDEILLTHGLWRYSSRAVSQWHHRRQRPYIANPHGMLDSWAVANSAWKKRIAGWLYENRHLREAHCLRALCQAEAEAIRGYGLSNPICVIPNGIDLPEQSGKSKVESRKVGDGRRILFSIGRLHPKKNLVQLLHAWREVKKSKVDSGKVKEWELVIAGWDELGHGSELRHLARELEIEDRVHFTGPLYGNAKDAAYQNADAFILPSLSEGLPMSALEAHAYGLPVLLTPECNLPESFTAKAAIRIGTDAAAIANGLRQLFAMSADEKRAMGTKGRELVRTQFNWQSVAREMHAVIAWVTGGGERPASILTI